MGYPSFVTLGLSDWAKHSWIRLSRFTPILWQECESPYKNHDLFPEITKEGLSINSESGKPRDAPLS
jgi:hypothetical protein